MRNLWRTTAVAAIAIVAIPFAAIAQVVPKDPAPVATTVQDCLTILAGLTEIDGMHDVISNAGKPTEQVVRLPYKFANGRFRNDLSKNIGLLTIVQRDVNKTTEKNLMMVSKGRGELKEPPPTAPSDERTEWLRQMTEFGRLNKEVGEAPCPIDGLVRHNIKDLKLDENEIRAGAVSNIDKILDRQ